MKYQIDQITKKDIPDIQALYQDIYAKQPAQIKEADELEWLFSDPHKRNAFLGYIARTEDRKLAGVIGYALNTYKTGSLELTGVIPLSWMISPSHRGILGIQLLKKVLKEGDFGFAIQGSEVAQQSYKAVRLKYIGEAHIYTKVLRPLAHIRSGREFSSGSVLKALYFLGRKKAAPRKQKISLKVGLGSQGIGYSPVQHLAMLPTVNRNMWLKSCPLTRTLSFTLFMDGKEMGPALCYISETKGIKRGRIVHIPYLGDELGAYRQAVSLLEEELIVNGCCSVSALAMQSASRQAFLRQGYKTRQQTSRKLYVSDPGKQLEEADLSQWYLTFYESDKAYRGI